MLAKIKPSLRCLCDIQPIAVFVIFLSKYNKNYLFYAILSAKCIDDIQPKRSVLIEINREGNVYA